ncbi:MAG: ATPase, T2SS/T4P/T4SS family [Elusimicrobiota bacterium]
MAEKDATAAEPSKPGPGRVVVFAGPREGVGKSTLALNLALAWAGSQNRKVIIVHLDPLCRDDLSFQMALDPPSLASLVPIVGENPTGGFARLLRGRIPMTRWGVGLLPLAKKRQEIMALSPGAAARILGALSEDYDLFLDVDPYLPMQIFAFDMADIIYWTCLPQRSHFEATHSLFSEFKSLHFALEKFELVINQANLPGALSPKEVDRFFQTMNKRVLAYMPWEDLIPECANTQRILVVESLQSDWVKQLRLILGRTLQIPPTIKSWDSAVSGQEFGQGADFLWRQPTAPAESSPVKSSSAAAVLTDVPSFWDELKGKLHKNVVSAMETEHVRISDDQTQNEENRSKVAGIIENLLQKESKLALSRVQREQFVSELVDEILGLGPLQSLLRDPSINEIMVISADKIYIEQQGRLVLLPMRFRNDEQVIQVIKRIVAPIGRRIDESVPLVDARLKDGSRVNAIIAPLAVSGPTLTIRRFSAKPYTSSQLLTFGSCNQEMIDFLEKCVLLRKNIIISGGTGTGKTTFLNMLSNYIPDGERIITVEDTAELRLMKQHWVRLEGRPQNIEGKGEVTIRDLVKNCLRMRPDRIVVGECRGGEALDMLQAMNTGHEGSLTTLHANSPSDAISRLSAMCLMAGSELPMSVLVEMISSAVNLFVQLTRFSDGKRRVTYITEVTGKDGLQISMRDIFRFHQTTVNEQGQSIGYFSGCGYIPTFHDEFKLKGLEVSQSIYRETNPGTPARIAPAGAIPAKRGGSGSV